MCWTLYWSMLMKYTGFFLLRYLCVSVNFALFKIPDTEKGSQRQVFKTRWSSSIFLPMLLRVSITP